MLQACCVLLLASLAGVGMAQDRTTTIEVPANRAWTRTGIILNPGSSVRLEARGLVDAVSPSDTRAFFHRVPPEGRPLRQTNKPFPVMRSLALIARIGDGPVLEAGAEAEFPAGDPYGAGELQLGINDDHVEDNSGSWSVRVTVQGASGTMTQQPSGRGRYRVDSGGRGRDAIDMATSAIESQAQQLGLGQATSDIRTTSDGVGRYRQYRDATIYWSPDTGAHELHGAIRDKWINSGAESGELGYPLSDESQAPDGVSRISRFQRGSIYWNARTGARVER